MIARSSGCGLCPWSCSGKVGAYVLGELRLELIATQ